MLTDIGPELTTCGPWRPIHVEQYSAQISDLFVRTDISVGERTASMLVTAEVEDGMEGDYIKYSLLDPEGEIISTSSLKVISSVVTDRVDIQDARFWWPTGLGKQPLYTIDAQLVREVRTIATGLVIELTYGRT